MATKLRNAWTDEENDYLTTVYTCPRLYKFWNLEAKRRGWVNRTDDAISLQIKKLRRNGELGSRRFLDEANGWVSKNQLALSIGVSESVIVRWIQSFGLKACRDGNTPNAILKISLCSFAKWAVGPTGYGQLSKCLHQNPLGIAWVFRQVGEYAFTSNKHEIPIVEPVKIELSIEEAIAYVIKYLPYLSKEGAIDLLRMEGLIEEELVLKPVNDIKLTEARIYRILKLLK